jgi:predicted MFS family arabinose efflux permease
MRREIAEGLRALFHHAILRATAACMLTREFFSGMYGALVVLYMARDLGFATGLLGMIWAVGGISSLIGAIAAEPVTRRLGTGPAMIIGLLLSCIAMLFIPLAQGATLGAALLLILQQISGDGAATLYEINDVSLRQAIAPKALLGRVNASAHFLRLGALLAGSLLGGLLGEVMGVRTTLFLGAFGALLSTLWLVFSPVRTLHAAPAPPIESVG